MGSLLGRPYQTDLGPAITGIHFHILLLPVTLMTHPSFSLYQGIDLMENWKTLNFGGGVGPTSLQTPLHPGDMSQAVILPCPTVLQTEKEKVMQPTSCS